MSKPVTPYDLLSGMITDAQIARRAAKRYFDKYDCSDAMHDIDHWNKTIIWLKEWRAEYPRPVPERQNPED